MTRARSFQIVFALALGSALLTACMSHTRSESALEVDASIAAVTLGDDCAGAGEDSGPGLIGGDCDGDGCGFGCTQTGMRLRVVAAETGDPVPFEVLTVRMYTMEGALADELSSRNPRQFTEEGYVAWEQMIRATDDLAVSYDLDAPDWSSIGSGVAHRTYGMSFRIEVDMRIDGIVQTLEFEPASREAEIVT